MIYVLKSPLAIYAALREAGVSRETALAAAEAIEADLHYLASTFQKRSESNCKERKVHSIHATD